MKKSIKKIVDSLAGLLVLLGLGAYKVTKAILQLHPLPKTIRWIGSFRTLSILFSISVACWSLAFLLSCLSDMLK